MDQYPEHCFAMMRTPTDHAVGLELQIVDVVEPSRRARVQDDTAAEFEARRTVLHREVASLGGVVVCSPAPPRYGTRFCVRAPHLAAALDDGTGSFHQVAARAGLAHAPFVSLEAPRSGAA